MLNHDEMMVLLELQKFARSPNSMGNHYIMVGVPSNIFNKLILGLGVTPMSEMKSSGQRVVVEGNTPQRIIERKAEEFFQAYLRSNPNDKDPGNLRYVRLRSENAAIVQYLTELHERGKI